MARVLVVDDAKTDRLIAEGILSAEDDLEIETANDGAAALARIESDPPDLVVTDLYMPEMDGIELVVALRERFPRISVILMTSQGSEEIAVRALKEGAASYVPKRLLKDSLVETVREILDLASWRRTEDRLMSTLQSSEAVFRLESHQELVRPLVKHLQEVAALMGFRDETDRMQIGVALCEALTNAIEHGNLEVDSEVRERSIPEHAQLMRERRDQLPYSSRQVHVEASFDRERVRFVVRDEGPGFDPSNLADPLAPANLGRLSGRGVMLIRSFMDEVAFNEQGNEVTMVKRRDAD